MEPGGVSTEGLETFQHAPNTCCVYRCKLDSHFSFHVHIYRIARHMQCKVRYVVQSERCIRDGYICQNYTD